MAKKFMYTYSERECAIKFHGCVEVDEKNFLEDGTPVEDFGAFALCDQPGDATYKAWVNELFGW